MALQRYEPTNVLKQFSDEINQLFGRNASMPGEFPALGNVQWMPDIDVHETEDEYHIKADVPGVDPKDIDITLENNVLTLKGERSTEQAKSEEGARHVERAYGAFVRQFTLPNTADTENVDARADNGVLHLTIKKTSESKPRKIEVKS